MNIVCKQGAHPFLGDLPDAELHVFDTENFAREYKLDEIGRLSLDFLKRKMAAFDVDVRYSGGLS